MKQTNAARAWLAKAKKTLGDDRYQNLLRHVESFGATRVTKQLCLKALIRLWDEEGLPITNTEV